MKLLITGGAGFIGVNAAKFFMRRKWDVTIFDDLSRAGSKENLALLRNDYRFEFIQGDIADWDELEKCFYQKYDFVLHLAAQTAVTSSIEDPVHDFYSNAMGTVHLLEMIRTYCKNAFVLYASTNKVYGDLNYLLGDKGVGCPAHTDSYFSPAHLRGFTEKVKLNFVSPYGCSKGAADQYVLDSAKIHGMKAVSFRQSCIYGPHQMGCEDQGWVAWMTIAAILGKKITIYGDGDQVRDVLYVEDLCRAYEYAYIKRNEVSGQAFNIGGGTENVLTPLKLIAILNEKYGPIKFGYADWRLGDQRYFVSNNDKAYDAFGWAPRTCIKAGLQQMSDWVIMNINIIRDYV